jgi:fibronectin type 3 domain-containing protein
MVPTAAGAPAAQLTRYPYLTDLVGSNVTVNFATTQAGTTASAQYGPAGNCSASTVSATRTSITVGSTSQYQWKAQISGLAADTSYCYRVYLGSTDLLASDPSPTFRSQVAAGATTPFSFAVFGDWGAVDSSGNNPDQANVMHQVAISGARFAVTTGDTAYPSGSQTNYGDLQQRGADTSAIFGPSFWTVAGSSIPLFNAQGNHGLNSTSLLNWPQDRAAASSAGRYQMDTYCCVNNTNSANYPSSWYAFDAGNARFYVLTAAWGDSNAGSATPYKNDYDAHWTQSSAEYAWLQADLQAHPGGLKFAFWHYPIYSDNATQTSDTYLRGANSLEGLLKANDVSMAFNGHAHIYQRNTAPPGGIVTYVTGGGGAKIEPISQCSSTDAYGIGWSYSANKGSACGTAPTPTSLSQVFHMLLVTVDGNQVTVQPTNSLGQTFDVQTYAFEGTADTEPPGPPANLVANAASSAQVDLAWGAASDNVGVTAYDVYRNGTLLISLGVVTTYSDTTAAPSSTYTYTVKARDAAGNTSPASNGATVTTPGPPPTLTFSPTDDTYLQASSANATAGNATTVQIDNSPLKHILLKFDVTGLNGRPVLGAKLRLYDTDASPSGGDIHTTVTSSWDEATATWNNAPAANAAVIGSLGSVAAGSWYEVDVSSVVSGDGVVSLRITSPSNNSAGYTSSEGAAGFGPQLVVSYDAAPPPPIPAPTALAATAGDQQVSLTWDTVSGATSYNLRRATASGGPYANLVTQPGTTYTDTGLTNGTTYFYVVSAANSDGSGPDSTEVAATPNVPLNSPNPPTDVQATVTDGRVEVSWSPAVGADAYTLKRATASSGPYSPIATGLTGTSATDSGVQAGATYFYVVSASNAGGTSADSLPAGVTVAPAPPGGLAAAAGDQQVSLSWAAASGATSYTLYRGPADGGPYQAVQAGITAPSYSDTGLTNDTTYYYVVTASNAGGESASSTQVSATPNVSTRTFVFSDGFETGDLSKWTTKGGLTVQGAIKRTGTFAAQGNTTNGSTYAKKLFSTTYTDGYAREWFYLASYSSQVNLLRYRTASDGSMGYLYVTTSGQLALRNDVGAVTTTSTTSVTSGAWHAIELHLVVNGTSSSTEVWLDEVKITTLSLNGQNWGTTPIGKVQIGEVQSGRTYNVSFDDVAFDTQRIGLAEVP